MRYRLLSGISPGFPELSQSQGQVTHVLLTRSPLIPTPKSGSPLDLHVLSTPPAFILSQDQTLHQGHTRHPHPEAQGSGGVQTELQHLTCRSSTTHRSTTRRPDPGGRPGAKSNPRAVQGSSIIRTMPFHQTRQTPAPQPKPRNHTPTRMTGLIGTGFSHTVEFSRSAVIAPRRFPAVPAGLSAEAARTVARAFRDRQFGRRPLTVVRAGPPRLEHRNAAGQSQLSGQVRGGRLEALGSAARCGLPRSRFGWKEQVDYRSSRRSHRSYSLSPAPRAPQLPVQHGVVRSGGAAVREEVYTSPERVRPPFSSRAGLVPAHPARAGPAGRREPRPAR
jgi:hypothetical protein